MILRRFSSRLLGGFLVTLTLAGSANAGAVFVRNRAFKGVVRGSGSSTMVELTPIVKALGLNIKPCNGGFLVTTDPKSDQGTEICQAGQVVIDGTKLSTIAGTSGETLVSLKELCDSVGAKMVVNNDMGSVDVFLESNAKARGPSLKDNWNGSPKTEERANASAQMAEGPGKASVQFFECFSLLPPCRDVKEMSQLCHKTADLERFRLAFKRTTTPEFYDKAYPRLAKQLDRTSELSTILSRVPTEELERSLASKPELAKKFTDVMVAWETERSIRATVSEQMVRGNEALLKVVETTTNPLTGKSKSTHVLIHLLQTGTHWQVDGLRSQE